MKKIQTPAKQSQQIFRARNLVFGAVLLSTVVWISASERGLADPNQCTVCHKMTTTLTFACNSLDYRRHKDHGDPDGACGASQ